MKSIWVPFAVSLLAVIVIFVTNENLEIQFSNTLHQLEGYQSQFAWFSFFVLSADIVLPVPSSIVMYLNGYVLGVVLGSLVSFGALVLGSVIGYYLGKFTSRGLKAKQDSRAHLFLLKYGALAILITRGIPILAESICVVCGYNNMPIKRYVLLNTIGYMPLCLLYGYFGHAGYSRDNFLLSFGLSLLLSAAFWWFGKASVTKSSSVHVNHV